MTTTVSLNKTAWPLSIKARQSAEGVTLLVQSDDWREGVTLANSRDELLDLLRRCARAVEEIRPDVCDDCGYDRFVNDDGTRDIAAGAVVTGCEPCHTWRAEATS